MPPHTMNLHRHLGFGRAARKIFGTTDLYRDGRRLELCPAETQQTRPSIHLPGELELVRGLHAETHTTLETLRVQGGTVHHEATSALRLRHVLLAGGHLYQGWRHHLPLSPRRQPWRVPRHLQRVGEGRVLACSFVGNRYFGHFVHDDLPLGLLAGELGEPVTTDDPRTDQMRELAARARVSAEPLAAAHIDELLVVNDRGQNRSRRRRYVELRDRLTAGQPRSPWAGVFLKRAPGETRALENEAALEAALAARGFVSLVAPHTPVSELIRALHGAPVAIGVEGSQMGVAAVTLPPGAAVVALQPADRFNNLPKDLCDAQDQLYGFSVCEPAGSGYRVRIDAVLGLLDRIAAMQSAARAVPA